VPPKETTPAPPNPPDPIAGLTGLSAYKVPHHPAPIDLVLSGNEGPPPPVELYAELTRQGMDLLRRYPDAKPLEALIAKRFRLSSDQVLVTAGADEALDRAFRTFLKTGDTVVLPSPTFVMLPHYARLIGAHVVAPPWPAEDFPTDVVLAALADQPKALALVSPNNPTGALIPKATLLDLARRAPSTAIFVDFAYIEMADEDPTRELLAFPNVLVFRTLSKAWGLAGARVGYVLSDPRTIAAMRAAGPPYSVTAPSLFLAQRHLETGADDVSAYVANVRDERDALYDALKRLGLRPVRSAANFVFARCVSTAQALWLRDGLAGLGIGVRVFPGDPTIGDGVRITCPGDLAQLERLIHGIEAVLAPQLRIESTEGLFGLGKPAWFLAKNTADIAHARMLGAVPIALGDPDAPTAHALLAAGAARVAPSFEALEATVR
jgi:histidinol-phosphate aminotransferase